MSVFFGACAELGWVGGVCVCVCEGGGVVAVMSVSGVCVWGVYVGVCGGGVWVWGCVCVCVCVKFYVFVYFLRKMMVKNKKVTEIQGSSLWRKKS